MVQFSAICSRLAHAYGPELLSRAVATEPEAAGHAERALPAAGRPAAGAPTQSVERSARAAAGARVRDRPSAAAAAEPGAGAARRRVYTRARAPAARRVGYVRGCHGFYGWSSLYNECQIGVS